MSLRPTTATIEVTSMRDKPILTATYTITGSAANRDSLARRTKTVGLAEQYEIHYTDDSTRDEPDVLPRQIRDIWLVLAGYKTDIETRMIDECPMILFHAADVYDVLDRVPHDQVVIACSAFAPQSEILYRSLSYRYMRASQKAIIGDLYGVPADSVIILPDVNYS